MKKLHFLLFLLPAATIFAQENPAALTRNFHFADGAYLRFEELQSNRPALPADSFELHFFTNPQTYLTQVEAIFEKSTGDFVDPAMAWAVVVGGVPYLRLPSGEVSRELPTFAALRLKGKICYFAYPDWRVKKVPVAAYNPLNGRPFRKGVVEREEEVLIEKMLHFETGEVADFTVENFRRWIGDDLQLVASIADLTAAEADEKLWKCLLIYVDRNAVFLKEPKRN